MEVRYLIAWLQRRVNASACQPYRTLEGLPPKVARQPTPAGLLYFNELSLQEHIMTANTTGMGA
jgi:hypothetical protein